MTHDDSDQSTTGRDPVPVATIRTKITDLDGAVTTQQILDHLESNGASDNELATVAELPEQEWADYNQALAAVSSGFEPRNGQY